MNAEKIVRELRELIATTTGYSEYSPRTSKDVTNEAFPNTGVFRVVVVGVGQIRASAGLSRYLDLVAVVVRPLSGGNANQSNLDAAIDTESLITALDDYDSDDALVSEEIDAQVTREAGRVLTSLAFRVSYKLS